VYFDATGVGRERLNEQYDSYVKRYADVGIDIATTPFEIAPAPHTSLGGIVVDSKCFSGVEGLFACGEIIGGLHGANRLGGNAGLETMVFGRIAGNSAADYLAGAAAPEVSETDAEDFVCDTLSLSGTASVTPELLSKLRAQMQTVLSEKLNVLRCGSELSDAVDAFSNMLEILDASSLADADAELCFETLRLVNDLQTAYLLAISAYTRSETVGCHVRTDSADETAGEKYRVVIRNTSSGAEVIKESI
jgi:succinate dehydrogenase/fumarate reductase flavoprotein subunit